MLLTPRGMANATRSNGSEPKGKIERVAFNFVSIIQDAPFHYVAKGAEDWQFVFVTMDPAGGFTLDGEGEGATRHVRRVDPSSIPPAMMPRL